MSLGLVGLKRGMSRIFTEDGESIPVTVIEISANYVMRVKSETSDGYGAVQVAWGEQLQSRLNLPRKGEYKKAGVSSGRGVREFRIDGDDDLEGISEGRELKAGIFLEGEFVDATGITVGKGFSGTVKRHHFSMQDATHGNSLSHRVAGSIGQCQTPGRVFKGKKMAGQLGNKRRTVQRLKVVKVDEEKNILLVKGSTPGPKGGALFLRHSVKTK